ARISYLLTGQAYSTAWLRGEDDGLRPARPGRILGRRYPRFVGGGWRPADLFLDPRDPCRSGGHHDGRLQRGPPRQRHLRQLLPQRLPLGPPGVTRSPETSPRARGWEAKGGETVSD